MIKKKNPFWSHDIGDINGRLDVEVGKMLFCSSLAGMQNNQAYLVLFSYTFRGRQIKIIEMLKSLSQHIALGLKLNHWSDV